MRFALFIVIICIAAGLSNDSAAHSGRTDSYGGHNNRKTGGYHFHNAGSAHHPGNPYQNHKTCGICATSKAESKSSGENYIPTEKEKIIALQTGLKCLGYDISTIDGTLGLETKRALMKFKTEQK